MILPGLPSPFPMAAGVSPSLDLNDAATFNGTSSYLERTSDLIGNADGKSYTLSVWLNVPASGLNYYAYHASTDGTDGNYRFRLRNAGNPATGYNAGARNAAGSNAAIVSEAGVFSADTWAHLLISIEAGSPSPRHIYIDDATSSPTWNTYLSIAIDFTVPYHRVGYDGANLFTGRLCHLYMDRTYRDLSVTANRRLFNDGAGAPAAGQASLNPILYLPLVANVPWGKNLGTGGDFTGHGALA